VRGERALTADTALRLGRFFGTSPEFWLGLEMTFDLETTRATLGPRLAREFTPTQGNGRTGSGGTKPLTPFFLLHHQTWLRSLPSRPLALPFTCPIS